MDRRCGLTSRFKEEFDGKRESAVVGVNAKNEFYHVILTHSGVISSLIAKH